MARPEARTSGRNACNRMTDMRRIQLLPTIALLCWIWSVAPAAAQQYEYPFQNPKLPVEKRAASILSLMTLDEKIAALTNPARGTTEHPWLRHV